MKISLEKRWEGIQWIPFRFPAYLIRNEKVGCSIHLSGTIFGNKNNALTLAG